MAAVSLPGGKRQTAYAKTRAEAKTKLEELLRLNASGVGDRRLTLGDYLAGWLRELDVSPATFRQYEMIVRVHLIPALGSVPLVSLTPEMVARYLRAKGHKLDGQTVRHHRAVLRRALNTALRRNRVLTNAAALVDAPRLPRKGALKALSTEQVRTLIEGTSGDRLHALYVLAATTGLRQAELLGLSWDDWQTDRLHVRSTLHRVNGEWILADPKTEKSARTVPLTSLAMAALTEHRRAMAEERTPDWRYHGLVFVNVKGNPIHGTNLLPPFYRHLVRLGLPRVPFHGLRHSAASVMLEAGVPLAVVAKVLGHSTIRVTADIYGHIGEKLDRDAARRMQEAVG